MHVDDDNNHLAIRMKRRAFLGRSASGIGTLAMASLLDPGLLGAAYAEGFGPLPRELSDSFTCTWPAVPRTWRRSITSQRSRG